jgi:hypothetical protein
MKSKGYTVTQSDGQIVVTFDPVPNYTQAAFERGQAACAKLRRERLDEIDNKRGYYTQRMKLRGIAPW